MKLESITLKNFQAHAALTVQFAPGVTTIKGPTDAGKSAVLRALRWVCLNDPVGADFIREGAKRVVVALQLSGAPGPWLITRIKSRDGHTNLYTLGSKEYKAFGQGVPPDIATALALTDINFQGQHDSPFWFADTAGEVSRKLNSVIDLSIIDTTLAAIASEVRRAQERKSLTEERLKEAQAQLEQLAPQRERVEQFKTLKAQQLKLDETHKAHSGLEAVLERIRANEAQPLAAQAEDGVALLAVMLAARRAQRTHEVLQGIIEEAKRLQDVRHPPDLSPVMRTHSDWVLARDHEQSLARLNEKAAKQQAQVKVLEELAQQAEDKFHKEIQDKACPLCGARFTR
jgi:hypothetical protein